MTGVFTAGDTDILRDAVRPGDVTWARARQSPGRLAILGGSTALALAVLALLWLGPEGVGISWLTRERVAVVFSGVAVLWAVVSGWVIFKLMPSRNDRVVLSLRHWVREETDRLDEQARALSDEALRGKRQEFQRRLAEGESVEDIRAEAYACVREASRRARNHRQFECQLIGARVLESGGIAEMRTGEGKTIVCYPGNYMRVLQGLKVHMVTVNDYLVKRDAEFCRPIFELLGVSVGYITSDMDAYGPGAEKRREAYACDITYGTNSEFGFDYLRDNMKNNVREQMQGRQDFAVVDEVDSILIDEARTPLIISGAANEDVGNFRVADNIARMLIRKQEQAIAEMKERIDQVESEAPPELKKDTRFRDGIKKFRADPMWLSTEEAEAIGFRQFIVVEMDRRSAHMTELGAKTAQAELGIGTFYDHRNMNWPHYIDTALRAHLCYNRDREYVVQDGTVIIVDEFTGRLMYGRQWSDGLHQAVEAKEKVPIKQETQTLATITLQNLFKMYKHLSGMTGTAMTEADEFLKIYKLETIAIPTNKPVRRVDYNDKIYKSKDNKFDAIVEEIRAYSEKGYPADPWSLYDMLKRARGRLHELKRSGEGNGRPDEGIELINSALGRFKDGEGEPEALEEAYLKLVGDELGGRPVLVGTTSVEASERLSTMLTRKYGVEHEVLNARPDAVAREAEIIAKAGQQHESHRGKRKAMFGNVTIATNMAGRGTDIVLGPGVAKIGGLHVVGTERHESRRIDNQLRGRCGRQGDPGSSRFFLSLEDDLLKLFMGEWMLKMLARFGMAEGVPIESRQLTRNIEAAQKKVEERNFGIRKNLLEYDEVMDHQRRTFYELRQRVVEARRLSELIWQWIDETVGDAVSRFYDPEYPALCVSEWVGQHLGVAIEPNKFDTAEYQILEEQVRELAAGEIRANVQRTFGEYIDPSVEAEEWDVRGLTNWAAQFGLTLTQRQVRETDPEELLEQLTEAAVKKVETADLTPLQVYIDPQYPKARLIRWGQEKFNIAVPIEALKGLGREEAERIFGEKMREAYRRREVEYPVQAVLDYALARGGSNLNEVHQKIAAWVNRKYGLNWTYEHFSGKNPQQIFQELRDLNADYLLNGKFAVEIDAALESHPGEKILDWAQSRFGAILESRPLELNEKLREQLLECGYEMLRYELTQLERLVVLTTLDGTWKDHMYSMDMLRHGIGLRGYGERDPKIEYKREGTRLFREMMSNIRERVTDLVFKVELSVGGGAEGAGEPSRPGPAPEAPSAYGKMSTSKADATNVGFASAAQAQQAAADRQAAMQRQGEGAKPQPVRRDVPKVGRNDPCPCGSGKKYKQCHGKGQ